MEKTETSCYPASGALFFLAGLGIGIATAALLTPRSGTATRRLIVRKVEEGEDWVKAKAAEAQDYVRCHADELGDRIKEAADVLGRGSQCGARQDDKLSGMAESSPV